MTKKRLQRLNWFYVPAVVLMILFIAYPLGNAIYLSFFKWNGYSVKKDFIGVQNYISMFNDKTFVSSLRNTLLYGFVCTFLQQVIGLAMAVFLNTKFKGRGIARTVIYMPAMVSGLVMGYIMYFFFQTKGGVMNDILSSMGLATVDWLGNGNTAIAVIIFINTWQFVGVSMVIYLAGIQGVSQSYIEAATVDGANAWQRFWNVTIPSISPIIFYNVLTALITHLQVINPALALTDGGPGKKSMFMSYVIYLYAFKKNKLGYAAAYSVIFFIRVGIFTAVLFKTQKEQIFGEGE